MHSTTSRAYGAPLILASGPLTLLAFFLPWIDTLPVPGYATSLYRPGPISPWALLIRGVFPPAFVLLMLMGLAITVRGILSLARGNANVRRPGVAMLAVFGIVLTLMITAGIAQFTMSFPPFPQVRLDWGMPVSLLGYGVALLGATRGEGGLSSDEANTDRS